MRRTELRPWWWPAAASAGSRLVSRSRCARYSAPARTLSVAEAGSRRAPARLDCTQLHVPGMICMIPRALAAEIIALLKPLSCQAIAAASDDGTPCCAASEPTCVASRRPTDATGEACGTIVRAGAGVVALIEAPVGSL